MRIGTLARRAGVGVETVRYYEREGLIDQPPKPANGGYRNYQPEIAHRIRSIRLAQSLGFSLKEIEELFSLKTDPATDCAAFRARAQAKLAEVNRKLVHLTGIQSALQNLIRACPGARAAARGCPILDALEPEGPHDESQRSRGYDKQTQNRDFQRGLPGLRGNRCKD